MSKCVSRLGEYSSHTFGDPSMPYVCTFCFAFDEDRALADLDSARSTAVRLECELAEAARVVRETFDDGLPPMDALMALDLILNPVSEGDYEALGAPAGGGDE